MDAHVFRIRRCLHHIIFVPLRIHSRSLVTLNSNRLCRWLDHAVLRAYDSFHKRRAVNKRASPSVEGGAILTNLHYTQEDTAMPAHARSASLSHCGRLASFILFAIPFAIA